MNRLPLHAPTEADIAAYERDGVVLLRGMLDRDWIDALRAGIDDDIARPGPHVHGYQTEAGKGRFHGNLLLWQTHPTFRDYCLNSPLPALAAAMLRTDKVNLLYDQLFVKEPGAENPTPWHNDQPYWPVKGWGVISFWLALDPVTRESGAVEYVRGSHRWNRWYQPETFARGGFQYDRNENYAAMPDIEQARDQYDIVSWDMQPGDLLCFHALALHGSGGNARRDVRRRGYTVRYVDRDCTYDPRPGSSKVIWTDAIKPGDRMDCALYPVVWPRPS